MKPLVWKPANNGSRARKWFVCAGTRPDRYLIDRRGNIRRYTTYEAAQCKADECNKTPPAAEFVWEIR